MGLDTTFAIRLLTMFSLGGLLFAVGLRLSWAEVAASLRGSRLGRVLLVNFLLVPALALGVACGLRIPAPIATGMLLLAAAPFAPVVPIFTKMAGGDVALAGTLTALFPFLSAFLTPVICALSLRAVPGSGQVSFHFLPNLVSLVCITTLPLTAGVALGHYRPGLGRKLLRPLEVITEGAGAVSLAFVTIVELESMRSIGWKPLLAMLLVFELSFLAGYLLSGSALRARRTMALGASNRNIALALLIALQSFAGTPILTAVVANGLLLIFLGLLHTGFWHFLRPAKAQD